MKEKEENCTEKKPHIPVMLKECMEYLKPAQNKVFIDCTFGAGGHTREILKSGAKVLAIDRDKNNKTFADELEKLFPQKIMFVNNKFSQLKEILKKENVKSFTNGQIGGVLYDFGVSSMQIDEFQRGFSFQNDGPLDMRMGCNDISAEDIVNTYSEHDLADIIFRYGDEHFARKIAKKIVEYRTKNRITTTFQLADLIKQIIPARGDKIHPATRTFQAIRIAVNNELQEIEKSLNFACQNLPSKCRIATITFHSLEDKIVKDLFKKYSTTEQQHFNRNDPKILDARENFSSDTLKVNLNIITKKPIVPTPDEIKKNVRSRSAKLRVAEII